MEIYLIRHTTPMVDKNVCYGQSDINVCTSFLKEANEIKKMLPGSIQKVYCSPLMRCKKLAEYLFPDQGIQYLNDLKEINCGEWELKNWNEINQSQLNEWMKDFVNVPFPGGENFIQLNERVITTFKKLTSGTIQSMAIITHAGVIRSVLSYLTHTELKFAFAKFKIGYGELFIIKKTKGKAIFNYETANAN